MRQGPAGRSGAAVSGRRQEKPRKARVCSCLKSQGHGSFSSPGEFTASPLLPTYRQPVSHFRFAQQAVSTAKGLVCLFQKQRNGRPPTPVSFLQAPGGEAGSGRQAGGLTSVPTLRLWREERAKGSLLRPRESRAKGQGFQVGLPSSTFTEVRGAVAPQSTSYTTQCSSNNRTGAEKVSSD